MCKYIFYSMRVWTISFLPTFVLNLQFDIELHTYGVICFNR